MINKSFLYLLILFFVSESAYPNYKLFPGYFINLKGDTILCQIEFSDWSRNPKTIHVKVENTLRELRPGEIKGFGINGYGDYLSASVNYHLNIAKETNQAYSDSTETKNCFLKVLEQGHYSLYGLINPDNVYLFIGITDSGISELIYRVKLNNDSLDEDQQYKKQIFGLFIKEGIEGTYFNKINKATYTASSIQPLIRVLNENRDGVKHFKIKSSGTLQMEVFIGAVRNSFPSAFHATYAEIQFDPNYSLSGGVNFLFLLPGHFKRSRIGLSIGYNGYDRSSSKVGSYSNGDPTNEHYTTTYSETVTFKNSLLVSTAYFMYVLNPLSKVNGYVKAGVSYNFSMSKPTDVTSDYTSSTVGMTNTNMPIDMHAQGSGAVILTKESFVTFIASAGVIIGRNRLEFSYWPYTNLAVVTGDPMAPSVDTFKFGSMAFHYYFSLLGK